MKKVYVLPVRQYDTEFYLGSYDPRLLVKMADRSIDVGGVQEAQRPWTSGTCWRSPTTPPPRTEPRTPACCRPPSCWAPGKRTS